MAHVPTGSASIVLAVALSVSALAGAPAFANIAPLHKTVNDIEYTVSESDALPAEQALVARIAAPGTDAKAAHDNLARAGLRYIGRDPEGAARFSWATTEMNDDLIQDVTVSVVLREDAGLIRSVTVTRSPTGS
jgi:hypothetical protein